MDGALIVRGMGFGLAVAAPVGPMSLLCMRRTLAAGWRPGLATGLGIAAGDGAYACVAAAGLAGLSGFMLAHQRPLHAVAGLFLLYLGLGTLFQPAGDAPPEAAMRLAARRAFSSAVLLTLTNPPTIVTFAAIFTTLTPPGGLGLGGAAATVAGVLAGSMLWWCGVVAVVSTMRSSLGARARHWISRLAGVALAGFGVAEIRRSLN